MPAETHLRADSAATDCSLAAAKHDAWAYKSTPLIDSVTNQQQAHSLVLRYMQSESRMTMTTSHPDWRTVARTYQGFLKWLGPGFAVLPDCQRTYGIELFHQRSQSAFIVRNGKADAKRGYRVECLGCGDGWVEGQGSVGLEGQGGRLLCQLLCCGTCLGRLLGTQGGLGGVISCTGHIQLGLCLPGGLAIFPGRLSLTSCCLHEQDAIQKVFWQHANIGNSPSVWLQCSIGCRESWCVNSTLWMWAWNFWDFHAPLRDSSLTAPKVCPKCEIIYWKWAFWVRMIAILGSEDCTTVNIIRQKYDMMLALRFKKEQTEWRSKWIITSFSCLAAWKASYTWVTMSGLTSVVKSKLPSSGFAFRYDSAKSSASCSTPSRCLILSASSWVAREFSWEAALQIINNLIALYKEYWSYRCSSSKSAIAKESSKL